MQVPIKIFHLCQQKLTWPQNVAKTSTYKVYKNGPFNCNKLRPWAKMGINPSAATKQKKKKKSKKTKGLITASPRKNTERQFFSSLGLSVLGCHTTHEEAYHCIYAFV